jgi:hypothetical protein
MKTFYSYISKMLDIPNYGGVSGASRTLIYKLELANQIASIIDLASSICYYKDLPNYQISAF